MIIPLSGGGGSSNQHCVVAVLMSLITTNDTYSIPHTVHSWRVPGHGESSPKRSLLCFHTSNVILY